MERFYNLAREYLKTQAKDINGEVRGIEGTLYYNRNGNLFDQILANRALLDNKPSDFKLVDQTAGIIAFPEMVSHKSSEGPIRFGLPKGDPAENINEQGFSDHFPIGVRVIESPVPV